MIDHFTRLMWKTTLSLAILIAVHCSVSAQTIITTIAGNGLPAYGGDGGLATAAEINTPYAVAVDLIGNVYIADYANNRIRKIDTFGMISTIAGTGVGGFTGDGGPATNAKIYGPRSVTTDAAGNVYFSDYANNRIRKINTTGIIKTVAGNGTPGFGGDGSAATAAMLNFPWGVGVDAAGNLYIGDQINCRIRKVTPAGIISTIGGNGIAFFSGDGGPAVSAGIQYPMGIAVDGPGNVYICDEGDCRIRKINTAGIISTVGGNGMGGFTGDGGPATSAKLYYPQGIARDNAGNLYVADLNNNRIREINTSGIINTVIGTGIAAYGGDGGSPLLAKINQATGVAVDQLGRIYVSDNDNNRIRRTGNVSHAPVFSGGVQQYLSFCPTESVNLDSLLLVFDIDTGQTETWSLIQSPAHGVAVVTYSTLSTGSYLLPSGLNFFQTPGYVGHDSFKVRIFDGIYADTTTIYVNILSLPDTGIISGIDSICPGATATFTDTITGGTWLTGNTSVATVSGAGVVSGVAAGTTTVLYKVSNACGTLYASYHLLVSAHCHTGVSPVEAAGSGLMITPNPAHGSFSLQLVTGQEEDIVYQITNTLGETVYTAHCSSGQPLQPNLNLQAGMYFVSAVSAGGKVSGKLVISR